MSVFVHRIQTVHCHAQAQDHEQRLSSSAAARTVAAAAGQKVPAYVFAACPASAKRRFKRTSSESALAFTLAEEEPSLSRLSISDDESAHAEQAAVVPGSPDCPPALPAHLTGDGSLLDTVLTAMWDESLAEGLFRYDLSTCSSKLVPGGMGFVAQLNEGRATLKRPTELKVDKVCQPFDETKFNFKKAPMREILFQFLPDEPTTSCSDACDPPALSRIVEAATCSRSSNLVLINVSPIEYGHVLLVPRVLDNLPQLVDESTLALALHFAKEADNSCFRVGFNSLGAYASINHLHFQAYYLDTDLPCELATTEALPCAPSCSHKRRRGRPDGVLIAVSRLVGYPVRGFVVEMLPGVPFSEGLAEMAAVVGRACLRLQQADIPHNLLITDKGKRVFLWPQCFAKRLAEGQLPEAALQTGVNPAVFEIAGHVLLKRQEDFSGLAEDQAAVINLLQQASLPEASFGHVAQLCFGADA